MIPKQFFRVWGGDAPIPDDHQRWWSELKQMHPDYKFYTLKDFSRVNVPSSYQYAISHCKTWSGISDMLRVLCMHQYGGIYLDTDIMPLKPFDDLVEQGQCFLGKRSQKSFEVAVMGSPKGHPGIKKCIEAFPDYYWKHKEKSNAVSTGPAFISSILFGREDVVHLPIKTFYPYNGFMSPKREEKDKMFSDKNNFPPEMIAAHYGNSRWGGSPRKGKKLKKF